MPIAADVELGPEGKIFHPELVNLYSCRIGDASVAWFGVVSTENLNTSYPLLLSLTFLLVTLGATVLFREPLPVQKMVGSDTLLVGIVLVASAR